MKNRNKHLFSVGAFAIILDERRRVLLCHRRDLDVWNLPGGEVESGELPTESVIREVREETGLEVVVERLVGVYGKDDKNGLVFAFLCKAEGGQLLVTDEADASQYFDVKHMPPNTIPKHVERIHDALSFNHEPIFRRQTAPSTLEFLQQLSSTIDGNTL